MKLFPKKQKKLFKKIVLLWTGKICVAMWLVRQTWFGARLDK